MRRPVPLWRVVCWPTLSALNAAVWIFHPHSTSAAFVCGFCFLALLDVALDAYVYGVNVRDQRKECRR